MKKQGLLAICMSLILLITAIPTSIYADTEVDSILENLEETESEFEDTEFKIKEDEIEEITEESVTKEEKEDEVIAEDSTDVEVSIFSYKNEKNGVVITGLKDKKAKLEGDIIIPVEIEGKKVIGIGNTAFREHKITSLTIEGEVSIGRAAFAKNQIKKLNLPNVKKIDAYAFNNNNIEELNSPNVKTIEEYAFNKNKIKKLKLDGVEEVGVFSFHGNGMETIELPLVKKIGDYAFYKNDLKEVNLEKVKWIGIAAFEHNQIEIVNLPVVKNIGNYAFNNNKIKKLQLDKVEEIGVAGFLSNNIEELKLPEVTSVGEIAFYGSLINSLEVPKLQSVGSQTFVLSDKLEKISLEKKLTEISGIPFIYKSDKYDGFMPITINSEDIENEILLDSKIVYNPTEEFDNIYKKDKDDYINKLELKEGQKYLWGTNNPFITAMDKDSSNYYCVDKDVPMFNAIYDIHPEIEKVYIINHGEYKEDNEKDKNKNQLVSLNDKP